MSGHRFLITGISTYWGGRLAQALERRDDVEAIIGVDSQDPTRELDRTEFVRVGTQHALLRRIVEAAAIDTVIDTRLVVDSSTCPPRQAHENNVIGTMNILAACSGPDSTVRRFVFKSSTHYYGCEQDDPAFFTEAMRRPHPPRTPIERDIVEAEAAVTEFAEKSPDVTVTVLRFANVLGPDVKTSHTRLFSLPVIPTILGFDPRYQFVHEDDVVNALEHVAERELPGVFNVAADGVLALSEVASLLGKQWAPLLPPWGTGLAATALRRAGMRISPEMLNQLRFGRGLDNRRLKATGFEYRYTSREAVLRFGEHLRLAPVLRGVREPYRYEREVEEFLRWSPSVAHPAPSGGRVAGREFVDLEKLLQVYADRAGVGPEAERRSRQARQARARRREAVATEAAERSTEEREVAEADAAAAERQAAAQEAAEPVAAAPPAAGPPAAAEPAAPEPPAAAEPPAPPAEPPPAAEPPAPEPAPPPVHDYDDLASEEIISLLASLEDADLAALRDHERESRNREPVVRAIEGLLARRGAPTRP